MTQSTRELSLSISCVYYDTPVDIISNTLSSLYQALNFACSKGILNQHSLYLINNQIQKSSDFNNIVEFSLNLIASTRVLSGHGNIGYGKGNNLAIHSCESDYHLILNPDVELAKDSIYEALKYLQENKDVAMIAPHATNQFGEYEYLAKRMPSLSVILIRGINKAFLNKIFKARLNKYAYKDRLPSTSPMDIELASGCFMFCRTSQLKSINGFCEDYFLYFEDFDLSKRMSKLGRIVYLPNVKIIHHGGMAARKGWKHIRLFLRSYAIFHSKMKNCNPKHY